jgi:hypothetical protein
MIPVLSSPIGSQVSGWQAGFLTILPAIQTHARIQFRRLSRERREDAIQEAIASACESFQRLAVQGRLHVANPTSMASYAVRRVRHGRHVGGSQEAAQDAMSRVAQSRHAFCTESYDNYDRAEGGWRPMAIEDRRISIPDLAAFRIDFARWLRTFTRRDRRIIVALIRGERTWAVADQFCISAGRVSQLRRKFERAWQLFQGENQSVEAAARSAD